MSTLETRGICEIEAVYALYNVNVTAHIVNTALFQQSTCLRSPLYLQTLSSSLSHFFMHLLLSFFIVFCRFQA